MGLEAASLVKLSRIQDFDCMSSALVALVRYNTAVEDEVEFFAHVWLNSIRQQSGPHRDRRRKESCLA